MYDILKSIFLIKFKICKKLIRKYFGISSLKVKIDKIIGINIDSILKSLFSTISSVPKSN